MRCMPSITKALAGLRGRGYSSLMVQSPGAVLESGERDLERIEIDRPVVVVVAATRAERERLAGLLPDDVTVIVAPSRERAEALLRHCPAAATACAAATYHLRMEPEVRRVCFGEAALSLTRLEFETLSLLTSDPEHVWSLVELSRSVWATGFVGDGAQVRSVIKRLRRKLTGAGAPLVIETVRGAGFRAVPLTS